MGMINAVGSLRYDMHGRKRKTNSLSTKKRGCSSAGRAPALHAGGREFESRQLHQKKKNMEALERARAAIPKPRYTPTAEEIQEQMRFEKEKQEISKGYTIAPAYNKGAYQVVPNSEIKCIGKK
tara:strand:+ start:779 stop:1150 length:372 start_codon:yes stop_codon:yes gene_type:complete